MAAQIDTPNGVSQEGEGYDDAVVELAQQLSNLRSNVLAGKHPRIEAPKHLSHDALQNTAGSAATMTASFLANGANPQAFISHGIPNSIGTKSASLQQQLDKEAANSQVDTIHSTIPPVHIIADIRQRRQRLEHALEEQLRQKKIMARQKTCDQEIVADFDVGEVLRKAQELVKPFKPRENKTANRAASSSDSFDENTFYSSQMNESTTTEEAENSRNWRRPLRICRFFRDGKPCPYGEKCTFSHDPAIVRRNEPDEPQRAVVVNNGRVHEPTKRRNISSPQPPTRSSAAIPVIQDGSLKDPQTIRIAELEEQLRRMKEEQQGKSPVVPRAITREDRQAQEFSVHSPRDADEFGRDTNLRNVDSRRPVILRQPSPSQVPHPVREYHIRNENPVSPMQNNVRVVRNHITSPYAPQPARVSPLAVAKLPQVSHIQQNHTEINRTSRGSNVEAVSVVESPNSVTHPVSSKKRRRKPDLEEQVRNVVPRRDNAASPAIRIKEEHISPPLYNDTSHVGRIQQAPEQSTSTYVEAMAPRPQERVIYRRPDLDDPVQVHEAQDGRPMTPLTRRIISRNGQHFFANEDADLRRVVSARQMRAPQPQAVYSAQHSDPQPRTMRSASQVQYVSPAERPLPVQSRASVQPQARERPKPSHPRQVAISPTRRTSIAMPPPSRRIVVDQFGNRFVEASVPAERAPSVMPTRQEPDVEYEYEELPPNSAHRQSQPVTIDEKGQYIGRPVSPTSPQYIEYPTAARRRQIVHLDEDSYEDRTRILYESRPVARYRHMDGIREGTVRMQSVKPINDNYEMLPHEKIARVSSVRPQQPRIVSLGEHREMTPRVVRQVSVHPDNGFRAAPSVQRLQEEPMYQYNTQEEESRYMEFPQGEDALYQQAGNGARRLVQRM